MGIAQPILTNPVQYDVGLKGVKKSYRVDVEELACDFANVNVTHFRQV